MQPIPWKQIILQLNLKIPNSEDRDAHLAISIQIVLEVLARTIKQEKEIKGIYTEINLSYLQMTWSYIYILKTLKITRRNC